MIGYPKQPKKKRRRHHKDSILQKKDGRCLLCMVLDDNHQQYDHIEEHHVFGGTANRAKSEAEGLKVYLCPAHHRLGPEAVHRNAEVARRLKKAAQAAYEDVYGHTRTEWMMLFGRNYRDEDIHKIQEIQGRRKEVQEDSG